MWGEREDGWVSGILRVRELLVGAGYTVGGVRELLGAVAGGALARDEIVPALRATRGGSPLEVLTRLFWLQVPVPVDAIPADELVAAGLVEVSGGEMRALSRVEPRGSSPSGSRQPNSTRECPMSSRPMALL